MSADRRKSVTSAAFSIAGRLAGAAATVVDMEAVADTVVVAMEEAVTVGTGATAADTVVGAAGRKTRLTRGEAGRGILRNASGASQMLKRPAAQPKPAQS